ncbi:hypothetical protein FVE85_1978 [Porphyridium purpureum]|uniref:Uncharacterized protein n=1 Tax=Porphyridium purpureum TaxID=35688 RepID=A0A5J4YYW7_PORPP|nr:hypothetical protein FVE85_1978 [Porphyridium purpureum]|eukprot:POR8691..scf209_3
MRASRVSLPLVRVPRYGTSQPQSHMQSDSQYGQTQLGASVISHASDYRSQLTVHGCIKQTASIPAQVSQADSRRQENAARYAAVLGDVPSSSQLRPSFTPSMLANGLTHAGGIASTNSQLHPETQQALTSELRARVLDSALASTKEHQLNQMCAAVQREVMAVSERMLGTQSAVESQKDFLAEVQSKLTSSFDSACSRILIEVSRLPEHENSAEPSDRVFVDTATMTCAYLLENTDKKDEPTQSLSVAVDAPLARGEQDKVKCLHSQCGEKVPGQASDRAQSPISAVMTAHLAAKSSDENTVKNAIQKQNVDDTACATMKACEFGSSKPFRSVVRGDKTAPCIAPAGREQQMARGAWHRDGKSDLNQVRGGACASQPHAEAESGTTAANAADANCSGQEDGSCSWQRQDDEKEAAKGLWDFFQDDPYVSGQSTEPAAPVGQRQSALLARKRTYFGDEKASAKQKRLALHSFLIPFSNPDHATNAEKNCVKGSHEVETNWDGDQVQEERKHLSRERDKGGASRLLNTSLRRSARKARRLYL